MELLKDSVKRTTSVQWPEVVDARLDALVSLAAAKGEKVSRAELLGMLVSEAPLDGQRLGRSIRAYRRLRLDAFTRVTAALGELPPIRRPGRRRRSPRTDEGNP